MIHCIFISARQDGGRIHIGPMGIAANGFPPTTLRRALARRNVGEAPPSKKVMRRRTPSPPDTK